MVLAADREAGDGTRKTGTSTIRLIRFDTSTTHPLVSTQSVHSLSFHFAQSNTGKAWRSFRNLFGKMDRITFVVKISPFVSQDIKNIKHFWLLSDVPKIEFQIKGHRTCNFDLLFTLTLKLAISVLNLATRSSCILCDKTVLRTRRCARNRKATHEQVSQYFVVPDDVTSVCFVFNYGSEENVTRKTTACCHDAFSDSFSVDSTRSR